MAKLCFNTIQNRPTSSRGRAFLVLTLNKILYEKNPNTYTDKNNPKVSKSIQKFQNSRFSYLPIFKTLKIQEFPNLDFSNSNPLVTSSCKTLA